MEKRSGVRHGVADAASGDLRASVEGDFSVLELERALSDVLGVTWKRIDSGGATRVVAYRSPASVTEEQRAQQAADRAFRDGLTRLVRAANLSDEDLSRALPGLGGFGLSLLPGQRDAVRALAYLSPEEQSRLVAGLTVERALATLPPRGQAAVHAMVQESNRRLTERKSVPRGQSLPDSRPADLQDGSRWTLRVSPFLVRTRPDVITFTVGVFEPGGGHSPSDFAVNVPCPTLASGELTAGRLPCSAPPLGEPAWHSALPDGYRPPRGLWDVLHRDLSLRLGCPVVSDAYLPPEAIMSNQVPTPRSGENLEGYLDRLCSHESMRRWGRTGRVLTFQRVDWPLMRRSQIPVSQARRWKQHILQTGRLALDDLLEMVALTPYQFANLGDVLEPETQKVVSHREMLLLWRGLPDALRRRAQVEHLDLRDLPATLQPEARSLVAAMLGSAASLMLSNARLHVEQSSDAFTLTVASLQRPVVVKRLDLKVAPGWQAYLKEEEKSRLATLEAAADSPSEPRVR